MSQSLNARSSPVDGSRLVTVCFDLGSVLFLLFYFCFADSDSGSDSVPSFFLEFYSNNFPSPRDNLLIIGAFHLSLSLLLLLLLLL